MLTDIARQDGLLQVLGRFLGARPGGGFPD